MFYNFDVKSGDVALMLLLVIVNGAASYPQASITNLRKNDAVVGSIEIGREVIKGEIEIPEKQNLVQSNRFANKEYEYYKNFYRSDTSSNIISGSVEVYDNYIRHVDLRDKNVIKQTGEDQDDNKQSDRNVISGSVAINNDSIKGHVIIPNDGKNENRVEGDNNNQDDGTINRSLVIDDENIEGHVDMPGDGNSQNGVRGDNNNQDDGTINGSIVIDDENIEGHVDMPGDGNSQNLMRGDNNNQDDGAINGSIVIDDENIEGHVDMPGDGNSQNLMRGDNNNQDDGTINGSIVIDDENIEGHVDMPGDGNSQNLMRGDNNNQDDGTINGSIVIDDENIEGHVDIPDNGNSQNGMQGDNNNQIDGTINGSIVIDDENIEGHVDIPDNGNSQNGVQGDNNNQDDGAINGSIVIDDENIEGHVDIPDNGNSQNGMQGDNNNQDDGTINGSIVIDDENIEGHVDVPGDSNSHNLVRGNNNYQDNGTINGSIVIDDENIEGHVDMPGDGNSQNLMRGDNNNQDDGTINGSIVIDDENIEGHVDMPGDDNSQNGMRGDNNNQDDGTINGSIMIDDENIEGHVDMPGDGNSQDLMRGDNNNQDDGTINGSITIVDENIEGHVDIPENGNSQNGMQGDNNNQIDGTINGSIVIDDKNIEGHVDIPDDGNSQNGVQGDNNNQDGGTINGSIAIDDENIDGHVDIPSGSGPKTTPEGGLPSNHKGSKLIRPTIEENCWMNLKSRPYLDDLDKLDEKYINARRNYQDDVGTEFDKKLMKALLESQGMAPRALHEAKGDPCLIPAGINLGGYCMMRMPGSLLFFHRMKLRNSTQFRVDSLRTNLMDMTLTAHLSLNDLHLQGAYERSRTGKDPTEIYYVPTFGELDVLLKDVNYKMEGRLRLLNKRLLVELVNSDLKTNQILLTYGNDSTSMRLQSKKFEDYLERLKADLDSWMKDYFNDYLMYFGIVGSGDNAEIQMYEKQKTVKVNEYADYVIKAIKEKLRSRGAGTVQLPSFNIHSVNNAKIKLKSGLLRGLDSIYRRSVATTKTEKRIRQLDFIISFSKLKVEYQYEAMVYPHMPPLSGMLMLSADELTAHVELAQVVGPDIFDLSFDAITQIKPESLTVEGPANRMIAEYKHILEHPITAIMLNIMKHNIKMLKSLTRCEPYLKGSNKNLI